MQQAAHSCLQLPPEATSAPQAVPGRPASTRPRPARNALSAPFLRFLRLQKFSSVLRQFPTRTVTMLSFCALSVLLRLQQIHRQQVPFCQVSASTSVSPFCTVSIAISSEAMPMLEVSALLRHCANLTLFVVVWGPCANCANYVGTSPRSGFLGDFTQLLHILHIGWASLLSLCLNSPGRHR